MVLPPKVHLMLLPSCSRFSLPRVSQHVVCHVPLHRRYLSGSFLPHPGTFVVASPFLYTVPAFPPHHRLSSPAGFGHPFGALRYYADIRLLLSLRLHRCTLLLSTGIPGSQEVSLSKLTQFHTLPVGSTYRLQTSMGFRCQPPACPVLHAY